MAHKGGPVGEETGVTPLRRQVSDGVLEHQSRGLLLRDLSGHLLPELPLAGGSVRGPGGPATSGADEELAGLGTPRRHVTDSALEHAEVRAQLEASEATLRPQAELPGQAPAAELGHLEPIAREGGAPSRAVLLLWPIPGGYSQMALMDEIDRAGFEGLYDLLYLPAGSRGRGTCGLAFLSLTSADEAESFCRTFQGGRLRHSAPQEILDVLTADAGPFQLGAAGRTVSELEGLWLDRSSPLGKARAHLTALAAAMATTMAHAAGELGSTAGREAP
mmetsp:Transcript_45745/g.146047  ORF Transcript_45745/g.146047 Transcript_45745/m.146047 type:complete len:276 (+) Transcript_45745:67-894(+)